MAEMTGKKPDHQVFLRKTPLRLVGPE